MRGFNGDGLQPFDYLGKGKAVLSNGAQEDADCAMNAISRD